MTKKYNYNAIYYCIWYLDTHYTHFGIKIVHNAICAHAYLLSILN